MNELTFHPHAWGEENAKRSNRRYNRKDLPDAYHEAIILRNAADHAARQYNPEYHPGKDATNEALGLCEHNFNPNSHTCMYCGEEE